MFAMWAALKNARHCEEALRRSNPIAIRTNRKRNLNYLLSLSFKQLIMVTNEFYSISENGDEDDTFELTKLGSRIPWLSFGNADSFETAYRDTTTEDYDRDFAYKLRQINPSYECHKLLDFHYNYYISKPDRNIATFLKHMKYVVRPILKEMNNSNVYLELLDEWILEKQESKRKFKLNDVMNNSINIKGVNGNIQIQQGLNNSSQSIDTFSAEDFAQLLSLVRTDIHQSNLSKEEKYDFHIELEKSLAKVEKGENIVIELEKVGGLINTVGLPIFLNLTSSVIFDNIRHYLKV